MNIENKISVSAIKGDILCAPPYLSPWNILSVRGDSYFQYFMTGDLIGPVGKYPLSLIRTFTMGDTFRPDGKYPTS